MGFNLFKKDIYDFHMIETLRFHRFNSKTNSGRSSSARSSTGHGGMAAAPQRHPGPRRPAPPRRVEALAAVGLRPDAARGHEPGTEDDGGEGATTGGHGGDGPGAQAQGGETWRGLASCGLRFDKNYICKGNGRTLRNSLTGEQTDGSQRLLRQRGLHDHSHVWSNHVQTSIHWICGGAVSQLHQL